MSEWLKKLSQRERIMIIVCSVLILSLLIWGFLIKPALAAQNSIVNRVASKQMQITNLKGLAANIDINEADNRALPKTRGSIVVIIDRATRSRQLGKYLKRNQPDGDSSVRLRFENAPFDQIVELLGELENTYGMSTSNANFDRTGPGLVSSNLVLIRIPE